MGHLHSRNIIIGVTGGIAAYKIAELIRLLRGDGASVRIILSRGAQAFVTPLTLQSLSGYPVHTELLDETAEMGMGHIELARWADIFLVAPATADTVARLAAGRADDLLTTAALATPAPLFVAPAMNQHMWNNAATTANIQTLRERGVKIIGPDAGEQACGDVGAGRLTEPETISAEISAHFPTRALEGKRAIITAGPTREPMDPVRYISNHSSGKMGFALAQAAAEAGAETILISGPVMLDTPKGVTRINVETALQMHEVCIDQIQKPTDLFVGSAAVADYRAEFNAPQKIKKVGDTLTLNLVRNPDIITEVAGSAHRPSLVVGFAAETEQLLEYAEGKRLTKQLDVVIANDVSQADIGFNSDINGVTWLDDTGYDVMPLTTKQNLAKLLIERCRQKLSQPEDQNKHMSAPAEDNR
ncbi:bifunctional phosphopantothenoylcysteine decarboxylase/phosphopantothenate--cysteine ligase CoaBC [Luminiphilus sp.]|nr:bifunctional phosphopantothenoylcysteine decarboxylase/phosphopantothenate--cysteine ligase CoaBC [Luminiphilus sp.]MDA9580612.1 bifunctional phosphopantothenoylcysteine decarboxylase/phosphopantothenate--cysteine ligase CoaBC [Luminiphilus sp.]MDB3923811.1 bifunctional phosphopantothenoylcysteine decarboxylase/phosphopantothenate--cysteine ligase CoaBC [Luminiphilus sp.]MDC3405397.1 bifunctional phosphopantothenoylcysteine decarboxylase/phosphopantothenate--cysteine ligase CoaBC [Luminiphilu